MCIVQALGQVHAERSMQPQFNHRVFGLFRRIAPTLLLSAIATGVHAQCDPVTLFAPQQQYATSSNPRSVAIGDLDADGTLDLVIANSFSNTVSVLLGNGDGTFQTRQDFAASNGPQSVAIGDLNGDGMPDLVVANSGFSTVSVLLGNGDGTFQTRQDFATGSRPSSVAIGDLDGDGTPDLAVTNESSNTVSVLLGNGDGTFQTRQDFSIGSIPVSVAIGDLNGDGTPDIAVANLLSDTVSVLLYQCVASPVCTGDIADDFGSIGADGQVSFGDFLALLGLIGSCGFNTALSPDIAFSVSDQSQDGIGDIFNASPFTGLLRNTATRSDRAVHEFDVSSLSGFTVTNATISGTISNNNGGGTFPRIFDFQLYAGNGVADVSDYQIAATTIGTASWPAPTPPLEFSFDVTSAVQGLLDSGTNFIGFRVVGTSQNLFASILGASPNQNAFLTIEGTTTCIGDVADDFGTIGNEDGQVSFGDFLALLGLIGPCP